MTNVLEVRGLAVEFDGFKALDGVDFTVEQGELRFLIGPNGAGKTTLIDCITGLTKPTAGDVLLRGQVDERAGRAPPGQARHRPQLPDAHRVRHPDGGRQPRPGRVVPHARWPGCSCAAGA